MLVNLALTLLRFLGLLLLATMLVGALVAYVRIWLMKRQHERLAASQEEVIRDGVLMEVLLEKENDRSPLAIEQLWNYFHSVLENAKTEYKPHFSFEIRGMRDDRDPKTPVHDISFNFWCPREYRDMLMRRIRAVYPTAVINILKEDYIPAPTDNRSVAACRMVLEEVPAYSLKVYDDYEHHDPLTALTMAMADLSNKETVVAQFLLNPVPNDWQKEAQAQLAEYEKTGKKPRKVRPEEVWRQKIWRIIRKTVFWVLTIPLDLIFSKPEEYNWGMLRDKEEKGHIGKLETGQQKEIYEKVRRPGYAVQVRLLVATPYGRHEAEARLNHMVASFREFDGDNRFVREDIPEDRMEEFQDWMRRRWFRIEDETNIVSTRELAILCHLPNQANQTPRLKRVYARRVVVPAGVTEENAFAYVWDGDRKRKIGIHDESRRRHVYICGMSGVGKSVLLANMIIQDINNNKGVIVIDPHGDLVADVLARCRSDRSDIYVIRPGDVTYPVGLNMFEITTTDEIDQIAEKNMIADEMIAIFKRVWGANMIGANQQDLLRAAALAVMEQPDGGSMLELYLMLSSPRYRERAVNFLQNKPQLEFYWKNQFAALAKNPQFLTVNLNPPLNKLRRFILDPIMSNILCQRKSTINIREVMNSGGVILCDLSKGRIGEENSALIGSMIMSKVQISAMTRTSIPEELRVDCHLYVDEFQNFVNSEGGGKTFSDILSEARKYRLCLTLAHQYHDQLRATGAGNGVLSAVWGNCGTIAYFRISQVDAMEAEKIFYDPVTNTGFRANDLANLDKYQIATRILVNGVPTTPFTAYTFPPPPPHPTNTDGGRSIVQHSQRLIGRYYKTVQEDIMKRMREYDATAEN